MLITAGIEGDQDVRERLHGINCGETDRNQSRRGKSYRGCPLYETMVADVEADGRPCNGRASAPLAAAGTS